MDNNVYILQKTENTFSIVGIIYDIENVKEIPIRLFEDNIDIIYDNYDDNFMSVPTIIYYNNQYYKINSNDIDIIDINDILTKGVKIDFNNVLNTNNNENENDDYEEAY